MKAGFIGLGNLGSVIAKRLMDEGVELVVWNRTRKKASRLAAKGAVVADNPAAVASSAEVIFLNLFDSEAVRAVIFDSNGLLDGELKGRVIIDTTTNHFESVVTFYKALRDHGASYLEAPVLGGLGPAAEGVLTVLASGDDDAYNRALPYLRKISRKIFYLEELALATKMKLINNLVLGSFMATLAEALAFGQDSGLDKKTVLDILESGAGNSLVLSAKKEKLLKEDFSVQFSSALIYKDLCYFQDLAKEMKRPTFTSGNVKELYAMTFPKREEGLDFSAVYKVVKEQGSSGKK